MLQNPLKHMKCLPHVCIKVIAAVIAIHASWRCIVAFLSGVIVLAQVYDTFKVNRFSFLNVASAWCKSNVCVNSSITVFSWFIFLYFFRYVWNACVWAVLYALIVFRLASIFFLLRNSNFVFFSPVAEFASALVCATRCRLSSARCPSVFATTRKFGNNLIDLFHHSLRANCN